MAQDLANATTQLSFSDSDVNLKNAELVAMQQTLNTVRKNLAEETDRLIVGTKLQNELRRERDANANKLLDMAAKEHAGVQEIKLLKGRLEKLQATLVAATPNIQQTVEEWQQWYQHANNEVNALLIDAIKSPLLSTYRQHEELRGLMEIPDFMRFLLVILNGLQPRDGVSIDDSPWMKADNVALLAAHGILLDEVGDIIYQFRDMMGDQVTLTLPQIQEAYNKNMELISLLEREQERTRDAIASDQEANEALKVANNTIQTMQDAFTKQTKETTDALKADFQVERDLWNRNEKDIRSKSCFLTWRPCCF